MHVLMLGWEFPPFISGGLGTACHGLVKALGQAGVDVTFVLPRSVHEQVDGPVRVYTPREASSVAPIMETDDSGSMPAMERVTFRSVPALLPSPYAVSRPVPTDESRAQAATFSSQRRIGFMGATVHEAPADYHGDLLAETQRYAALVLSRCRKLSFDVIHAHDWLTFPAGMALAGVTNRPLIVHVHSTEFDRAGEHGQGAIRHIEHRGMHAADRVICVSFATAELVQQRYHVPATRISVVHNAVDAAPDHRSELDLPQRTPGEKRVLFLGRITEQKGPEFFLDAATHVLERRPNVSFIMAGAGDLAPAMIESAARRGIGDRIRFTGFLRGQDVDRIFNMVDVFVMPSVSEPFGITALEAVQHGVPVIVSRSAGVSEVLRHCLKVDFWDTTALADRILGLLAHPELGQTMAAHAHRQVRRLTWDDAATKLQRVYAQLMMDKTADVRR